LANFSDSLNFRGETRAQSVTQSEALITVSEGAPLDVKCIYSYTGFLYFSLYSQYPNQEPQLLLESNTGRSLVKGIKGFEAEFNEGKTSFHLKKLSAQGSDSVMYFCVLSTQ
uniref:Immunoglobulin V-set domain-containing protein n=1 Tax=Vombatus ursinus TaxID=29139 RepID=A0A4X2LR53_VOMUR